MKKKIYYELIAEYNSIISMKRNDTSNYYDSRLTEIKTTLIRFLERAERYYGVEVMDAARKNSSKAILYVNEIERLGKLCGKIANGEPVESEDYEDTFCKKGLWNLLFRK